MSIVAGLTQPAPLALRTRRRAGPSGFYVEDDAGLHTPASVSATPSIGLPSLLAFQEAEADAAQDRAARRHAGSMLAELSAVQRALLLGDAAGKDMALGRLSSLTRHGVAANDPRLAAVVQAVAMRAAVEAARRQQAAAHR